jgi:hypothetical protein
MTTPRTRVGLGDGAIVLSLYAASTALYWFLGVTFDVTPAEYFMQFIDPRLLNERFLESIWYYHATPPMLNVLFGIGLKLFGSHQAAFFSICFHALGLLTASSVYLLTWALSYSRIAAGMATALVVFNPDFVLFQNWFMYELPAVAFLTMSALALHRYVETRSTRWCVLLFALLAVLLLTRSIFHIAWMVLIVGALAVLCRDRWRQVLTAAALPLLVVAGWYGKNLYYFGSFSSSSWLGLGFTNISTLLLTPAELDAMVQRGEISELARVSRYDHLPLLFSSQGGAPTGIPVLDEPVTSTRALNYNYEPIVAISGAYLADGLKVVRAHPGAYLGALGLSNRFFFSPNHINPFFVQHNRNAALYVHRWTMPLLYGVPLGVETARVPRQGWNNGPEVPVHTSIPLIIAWVLLLGYGYTQARKAVWARDPSELARAMVIGFIVLTCLYVYGVGTTLELSENSRYRFLTEPLFMVLGATAIVALIRKLLRALESASAADGSRHASA